MVGREIVIMNTEFGRSMKTKNGVDITNWEKSGVEVRT